MFPGTQLNDPVLFKFLICVLLTWQMSWSESIIMARHSFHSVLLTQDLIPSYQSLGAR